MVPKRIFTIWLNEEKELPPLITKCIESQKIPGYEHRLITLDNCFKDCEYMQQCLNSPYEKQKWCKASDYLRMHYLYTEGGIYLDADVEILPGKNFDECCKFRMFCGMEANGFNGTAVVGAEKGYPFLKQWIDKVTSNFRGDDNKNFESSMDLFTKGKNEWNWYQDFFMVYTTDYFYPYNHQTGMANITDNSITYHHFMKSWV
jgi:mannosyltransferase OCH1-like enzyme